MTLGFIDSKQPEIFSVAPRTNLAIGFINPLPFAFNVAMMMWAEKKNWYIAYFSQKKSFTHLPLTNKISVKDMSRVFDSSNDLLRVVQAFHNIQERFDREHLRSRINDITRSIIHEVPKSSENEQS